MTLNELQTIAETYVDKNIMFPDSSQIALKLNIRIKNSTEAKIDFKNKKNPLEHCNGCLALDKGEYVVYYDENSPYRNFNIAHEIAHYLLHHNSDGEKEHHEANILASILVAPIHSILKNKIKNETELSTKYKIPIETAQTYWKLLDIKPSKKALFIKSIGILLAASIPFSFSIPIKESAIALNNTNYSHTTNSIDSDETPQTSTSVYVTPYGTHYHLKDCQYIKHKTNITEISIEDTENLQLEQCSKCF